MTHSEVLRIAIQRATDHGLMLSSPKEISESDCENKKDFHPGIFRSEFWKLSEPFPEQKASCTWSYELDWDEVTVTSHMDWAIFALENIEQEGLTTGQLQGV